MKTAISIPDDVFAAAERLAAQQGQSRSRLYSVAVAEYVARHDVDAVGEALERALAAVGEDVDGFATEVSRRQLKQVEW